MDNFNNLNKEIEYVKKLLYLNNLNKQIKSNLFDSQIVNDYLARSGYIINGTGAGTCAKVIDDKYQLIRDNKNGYDYCLYINVLYDSKAARIAGKADDPYIDQKYMYKVVSYMKFDFPIVGSFMKLPIKSETKVITKFK